MASDRKRPSRLGRGLSSLMAQSVPAAPPAEPAETTETSEAPKAASASKAPPASGSSAPVNSGSGAATGEPDRAETVAATASPPAGESGASGTAKRGDGADDDGDPGLRYIPVGQLRANPHQPRQHFDEAALARLADSIRADGLMQPIVVRPAAGSEADGEAAFEIVAGERRWRAASFASLEHVPAIVRELDDQALAEWALIENLQREDLNPIERAEAFQGLAERFGLGHDEIAQRVGLERSTISNLLRLLQLSEFVQDCVREGALSMGQARAIAGVSDAARQRQLAERAVKQGLSVRQVEQLARQGAGDSKPASDTGGEPSRGQVRSAYLADLEQQLAEQLQTRVKVRPGRKKGSGTLTVEFYTLDQFDTLMEKLGVSTG